MNEPLGRSPLYNGKQRHLLFLQKVDQEPKSIFLSKYPLELGHFLTCMGFTLQKPAIITRGLYISNPFFEGQRHFFQGGFFSEKLAFMYCYYS